MKVRQGFTLIEILVVVVIMGILAAVAVPKLFGSVAKAKASEIAPAASTYKKLQDLYIAEKGVVGNWKNVGYIAPGNGTTNNFTYCGGEIDSDIEVGNFGDVAKVGWQATNKSSLNGCSTGHWWFVSLKPESGHSAIYTHETNASECIALAAPHWEVSNRSGVACGVAGDVNQETGVVANQSVMTNENVEVKLGAWCSAKAYCANENAANRFRVTNSESESGLFKLEANSTYEFKISAGSSKDTDGALTSNDLNIGLMIYETDSQNAPVTADMGWTSDKTTMTKGNYTMTVMHDKATNEYVVTIQTKEQTDAYFGVNMRSNASEKQSGKKVSQETKDALTNAAKTATLTKVSEETKSGSSSSKK